MGNRKSIQPGDDDVASGGVLPLGNCLLGNASQRLGEIPEIGISFVPCFFNGLKDRTYGIDEREQGAGDPITQFNRAISQLPEEVLATVGNRAKLCKTEESAGAFDGMDRTKDTRKTLGIAWIFLECDQVLVELVEILRRLNEKFPHKFFVLIHKKVVGAISLWSTGEHYHTLRFGRRHGGAVRSG